MAARVLGHGRPAPLRRGAAGRRGPAARWAAAAGSAALPPPLSRLDRARDLPAPPARTFREWWRESAGSRPVTAARGGAGPDPRRARAALPGTAPRGASARTATRSRAGYRTGGDLTAPPARPARRAAGRLPRRGPAHARRPARRAVIAAALTERGARRVVVPPGLDLPALPGGVDGASIDDGLSAARPRRVRRRRHRGRGRDRRDRHHRARRLARPGPARDHPGARLPPLRRARRPGRRAGARGARRGSTPTAARSPGSAARRRPATSSSTGSRACTAPARSRSSWSRACYATPPPALANPRPLVRPPRTAWPRSGRNRPGRSRGDG